MGLEERLRRLRAQAGGTPVPTGPTAPAPGTAGILPALTPPTPPSDCPPQDPSTPQDETAQAPRATLAERLRRVSIGRGATPTARVPDECALAEILGAEPLAPGVLRIERRLSARLRHGRVQLGPGHEPAHLPLPPSCACAEGPPLPWLCLDTETSGLAGGTGTWAFLAGLLRQTDDGWHLTQILLTRLDTEPDYLDALAALLAAPARLVTYNGRAFDAPLLATRFRLAARADPVAPLPHLDLLAPVRRAFDRLWPDCRLVTAEQRLLGVRRDHDLPGSEAPAAWLGWLRRGETGPLARVLRHNRDDLLSLAALMPALDRAYADPAALGANPRAVAAAQACAGRPERARAILAANRRDLDTAGLLDLARLCRRAGDWADALALWEPLAAAGDPDARAALARYHEHRTRDLARALDLTEGLPPGEDRERRRARLKGKLLRVAGDGDAATAESSPAPTLSR